MPENTPDLSPTAPDPFDGLLDKARAGCRDAAQELITRWVPAILHVIRQRLDEAHRLRSIFDSDDFLQETRLAVFRQKIDPSVFTSLGTFFRFVVAVAMNKLREAERNHFCTAKRNLNREVPLDAVAVRQEVALAAGESTLSAACLADEEFQRLLQAQTPVYGSILCLLRDGKTYVDIAATFGLDERTVRRIVVRIAKKSRSKEGIFSAC